METPTVTAIFEIKITHKHLRDAESVITSLSGDREVQNDERNNLLIEGLKAIATGRNAYDVREFAKDVLDCSGVVF